MRKPISPAINNQLTLSTATHTTMTPYQAQAVQSRVGEVLVSAGAGSGKTRVLTERCLALLDDGCPLERILTLTFTRKAAQEMRERIGKGLEQRGNVALRRELSRAPIGTIHGFCERVLREHALQAGIDPNFRLLDDAEAHTLQDRALDTVFEEVWDGGQREREVIGRLLLDFPHHDLRTALLDIYRSARTQGHDPAALRPLPGADMVAAGAALIAAADELIALPGTDKWQQAVVAAGEALDILRPLLRTPPATFTWEQYDSAVELIAALTPAGGPKELAKSARDAVKAAAETWLGAFLDCCALPYQQAFLILLVRLDTACRRAKDEQGLLDFEDLLLITRDLLLDHNGGAAAYYRRQFRQVMVDEFQDTNPLQFSLIRAFQGDGDLFMVGDVKQAIYRFIGSDIRVFLAQERRIAELGTTGTRIALAENFRTRPELLHPLNAIFARLWPEEADDGFCFEPLLPAQAFFPRQDPAIEMALWTGDTANALRSREATWIARRILQLTGWIGDPLLISAEHTTPDKPTATRPADFGDIIVLFRASTDIPRYEEALRHAGVPLYVVSGRGFYQAREVQDLVHLLKVVENPWDDFSLAVVLRSPLVGVNDDTLYWLSRDWQGWSEGQPYPADIRTEPRFGRLWDAILRVETLPLIVEDDRRALVEFRALLHDLQQRLPAGQPLELIDLMLARTGYADSLLAADNGEQRYANVQKLREVAADFQRRGIFDLTDFKHYLTQLEELAPREASAPLDVEGSQVVRLMTIHAAKGLEAPIVFLADCGRDPQPRTAPFLLAPEGITGKVPTPEDDYAQPASYRATVAEIGDADRREAERLLYVALTRAREHLICSGFVKFPPKEGTAKYADLLANLLEVTEPPGDDCDIPLSFDGHTYPVRVWSGQSLDDIEKLEPPVQARTLAEAYADEIRTGVPMPVLTTAADVDRFTRILDRLQPLPVNRRDGPLRVGVNRAICYDKCPRQYWFRYVLNREGTPLPGSEANEASDDEHAHVDGTAFGLLLHAVLQRVPAFTVHLLDDAAELARVIARESDLSDTDNEQQLLRACLQRLMETPIFPALQHADALYREQRFLAHVEGVYVPGIIDVLARDDDSWWILDYKTGHPSADHARQLGLYALGVEQALGMTPSRVVVAYLHPDASRTLREDTVTPALLDEARRLILNAGDGIRRDVFPAMPGRACTHCPFTGLCPAGREALMEVIA